MKVRVLIPRSMSEQKKGEIINMFNIEKENKIFYLFGGTYEKIEEDLEEKE